MSNCSICSLSNDQTVTLICKHSYCVNCIEKNQEISKPCFICDFDLFECFLQKSLNFQYSVNFLLILKIINNFLEKGTN